MNDHHKTREELIKELTETRRQNAELQKTIYRLKKDNEVLCMRNENYDIHFTIANDIMFSYDSEFRVLSVTPNVERVLGYKPDEIIGRNFQSLGILDPIDIDEATEDALVVLSGNPIFSAIYKFIAKNGEKKYGEGSSVPIKKDGRVIGSISVARDITQRVLAEEELKEYRDHLEDLVKKRTAEFMRANELLEKEIEERKRTEGFLKISEKRFRSLIQKSLDLIVIMDRNGVIIYETPSLQSVLGYQPGYLIGKSPFELIHPADFERVVNDLNEVYLKTNPGKPTEFRFRKADGTWVYLEAIGQNLLEDLAINGIVITARDITDRKLKEEALRQSEAKYRFLTEKMNDIIWTTDLDFNITYQSPSVNKVLGFDRDDRMGQDVSKRITPQSLARAIDLLNTELKHIQEEGVDPERTVKLELDCYHKNGSIVSMECIASPIVDGEGKVAGIYGVSRDITDRKHAEHLSQISQKKFVAAFHDSPAPMVITDAESGKIIEANRSFLAKSDYSLDEVIGHTPIELDAVSTRERDKLVKEVLDKGKVDSWEYQYRIKGGGIRDVLHSAKLIEIDNRPCILSHFNDITDLRRAEEELKKHRDQLEELVRERTAELSEAYEQLKQENEVRKTTELTLRSRERELEKGHQEVDEVNAALKVLLKHREEDKANMEMDIISNIKISVLPYVEKLEASRLEQNQKVILSLIKSFLNDIVSPFVRKISSEYLDLTPSEIKVASLIKEGKTSKDIAEILHISLNTVVAHRHNIRKKTGLKNKKVNLRSYLQTSK